MLETRSVYAVDLEVRQVGERPTITGRFPYNSLATTSNTGRRRKERFAPKAFEFVLRPDQLQREVNFLQGHNLSQPLAARSAGTLELADTPAALTFQATLPVLAEQTTWQRDFMLAHSQGLIKGISPGFLMPPRDRFPDAEIDEPEPGNPGIFIRTIKAAVLAELSAATRPIYPDTSLEARAEDYDDGKRRYWQLHPEALRWL